MSAADRPAQIQFAAMSNRISRRHAVRHLACAAAGALVAPAVLRGQSSPIIVAGQPVEIAVASIGPSTVRITVVPIANPLRSLQDDGALVSAAEGKSLARETSRRSTRASWWCASRRMRRSAATPST
jgi:hypothetical protein